MKILNKHEKKWKRRRRRGGGGGGGGRGRYGVDAVAPIHAATSRIRARTFSFFITAIARRRCSYKAIMTFMRRWGR